MSRNLYDVPPKAPPATPEDVLYEAAKLSARADYFAHLIGKRKEPTLGMVLLPEQLARLAALLTECGYTLRGIGK